MIGNYPPSTWYGDSLAPWNEEQEYENRMCYECMRYHNLHEDVECVDVEEDWHACPDFILAYQS